MSAERVHPSTRYLIIHVPCGTVHNNPTDRGDNKKFYFSESLPLKGHPTVQ